MTLECVVLSTFYRGCLGRAGGRAEVWWVLVQAVVVELSINASSPSPTPAEASVA